jgi:hypothetical protein
MHKRIIIVFLFFLIITVSSCEDVFQQSPPDVPVINPLGSRTINSIDIIWSKYNGDDFERYEVYYRKKYSPAYSLYSTIKNERQIYLTVSDLEPKTEYQFYVRAIDKKGQFTDSEIYKLETLSDQPSPVAINRVNQSDITHQSIGIVWSQYVDDYAVPFLKYEVYCSTDPKFKENYTRKIVVTDISPKVVVPFLSEKTLYYFVVRTYNKLQKYSESNIAVVETLPAPPDNVSLIEPFEITETTAKIKWTKSNDTGFSRYQIHLGDYPFFRPDSYNLVKVFSSSDSLSYSLKDLKKDWEYFVIVVVHKNNSTFSNSDVKGFTSYPGGGPVPVSIIDPVPPEQIQRNRIVIQWTPSPSRFLSKYEVQLQEPNSTIWKPVWKWDKTVDRYLEDGSVPTVGIINNLKPNTIYSFRVMVYNEMVKYNYSPVKTYKTLP